MNIIVFIKKGIKGSNAVEIAFPTANCKYLNPPLKISIFVEELAIECDTSLKTERADLLILEKVLLIDIPAKRIVNAKPGKGLFLLIFFIDSAYIVVSPRAILRF